MGYSLVKCLDPTFFLKELGAEWILVYLLAKTSPSGPYITSATISTPYNFPIKDIVSSGRSLISSIIFPSYLLSPLWSFLVTGPSISLPSPTCWCGKAQLTTRPHVDALPTNGADECKITHFLNKFLLHLTHFCYIDISLYLPGNSYSYPWLVTVYLNVKVQLMMKESWESALNFGGKGLYYRALDL